MPCSDVQPLKPIGDVLSNCRLQYVVYKTAFGAGLFQRYLILSVFPSTLSKIALLVTQNVESSGDHNRYRQCHPRCLGHSGRDSTSLLSKTTRANIWWRRLLHGDSIGNIECLRVTSWANDKIASFHWYEHSNRLYCIDDRSWRSLIRS